MNEPLTNKKIFLFWLPLLSTWLMMAVEGPFLAAIIARMADAKFNLAAYGVAYSFAVIIEAPVIMIMSASTALVKDKDSFLKLKNFIYSANTIITVVILIFLIPPVFDFVAISLIKLPLHVAQLTYKATLLMIPWPAAIGYRRFYHGILIKNNLTRRVAYCTIIRLASMAITGSALFFYGKLPGVIVGAASLSCGVVSEAIMSKIFAYKIVTQIKLRESLPEEKVKLKYSGIFQFYYPLALMSFISLAVHPMVTFFMGQAKLSIESLAILPVLNSLVFVFRSFGLSFQEVVIALIGENGKEYKILKKFSFKVGVAVTFALVFIAFTPIGRFWFRDISGLSESLTEMAILPLQIISIMPGLTMLLNFQRAIHVTTRVTKPLTMATLIELISMIIVLVVAINFFGMVGATAAVISYMAGRLCVNYYLHISFKKIVKKLAY